MFFPPKICEIKLALIGWIKSPMDVIHVMTESMIAKCEKYWGVMAVGTVLDPYYKVDLLDYPPSPPLPPK